jgi:hypothetical protein
VSGPHAILAVTAIRNALLVGTVAWGLWQLRAPAAAAEPEEGALSSPA